MIWRFALLVLGCFLLSGCALFGVKPLPQRLSEEGQQRCDYGWRHFVAQCNDVEHTAVLDALLLTQAWHAGVDRLYLRSEKQVGDVLVVMETTFERDLPDDDAFSVTFYDVNGEVLRQERFTSAEIDAAIALYQTSEGEIENETPEEHEARLVRLAERNARLQRASEVFPAPPEEAEAAGPE